MKRQLLTLALTALVALSASAVPARRGTINVQQPDGTTVSVVLMGDEAYHYYQTLDGMPLLQTNDGAYVYATIAQNQLTPTNLLAHNADMRGAKEVAFVSANSQLKDGAAAIFTTATRDLNSLRLTDQAKRINKARAKHGDNPPVYRMGEPRDPLVGEKHGLVILVNFKDIKMQDKHGQTLWNDYLNKEGYNGDGGPQGSVRDYFLSQSYNQFDLKFDVVGPVNLSRDAEYYGTNKQAGAGQDGKAGHMVAEAVYLADDLGVDFTKYDWDKDGEVDQIVIVYAGYGENDGAPSWTIWPHEYWIYWSSWGSQITDIDGVTIDKYACSPELTGNSGTSLSGIGVLCHEFGHCLGLPDFYATVQNGQSGMQTWDPMDYGSYNGTSSNRSDVPSGYTTYERMYCGWLTPTVLDKPSAVNGMRALTEAPDAYIIYNDAHKDEYYTFENRQKTSWDSCQPGGGHGMLVTHVDFSLTDWNGNGVNRIDHMGMQVVPADNTNVYNASSIAGDPYPGTTGNHALTESSRPAATLYHNNVDGRKLLGKDITKIEENTQDGTISFLVMGGFTIDAPTVGAPTDVADNTFTANWTATDNAATYTLQLLDSKLSPEVYEIMTENFNGLKGTSSGGDQSADIATKLDSYLNEPGWKGTRLYQSEHRLKFGTLKYNGTLITPYLTKPNSGKMTVRFSTELYMGTDNNVVEVKVFDAKAFGGDATANDGLIESKTLTTTDATYVVNFGNIDKDCFVAICPVGRFYLGSIALYDGEFSDGDFAPGSVAAEMPEAPKTLALMPITLPLSIEGITDTHYTFTGIPAGDYLYRVRGVNGNITSNWSETMPITVTGEGEGIINATVTQPMSGVEVRTADGRLVRRSTTGNWQKGLPAGIYLVGGHKVVLK